MLNKSGLKKAALSTATVAALATVPMTQATSLSPETQQAAPYEEKTACSVNFDSDEALLASLVKNPQCYDSLGYGDGYGDGGDQSCIIPEDNDQTLKPNIQALPECGLAGLERAKKTKPPIIKFAEH